MRIDLALHIVKRFNSLGKVLDFVLIPYVEPFESDDSSPVYVACMLDYVYHGVAFLDAHVDYVRHLKRLSISCFLDLQPSYQIESIVQHFFSKIVKVQ